MSQDNIFREVDEELRSDRMRSLWRRFAPFVIGAAVAVVAIVAVNEGWSWYHSNNAASSSDELYVAFDEIDGGDLAAAQTQLDAVIANGSGSYPVLAQFRKAGVLAKEGNVAEAVAAYDALANSQSNARLRELALVLAGTLMVDGGTLSDVDSRVGSIAAEGSPLRNAAREALGLAQYKAGDFAAAQSSFEAVVNDPMSQSNTRNRMGYYLAQLLSEGAIDDAPASDDAEAAATAIDEMVSDDAPTAEAAPAAETPAADTPAATTPETPAADAPAAAPETEPAAQ
ncbi:MAG: tetratricopeptide repeat protein [Candidatus Devosia phytovorans]|uniref:Tetratricopeptide repeat protein n=1 Tax=Candidatus Devosia phytovorans TaxID=3121372 RepID=A0AAJ5VY79_9HYPH|nr:tetratricopeptide repeat protein [Devosia sp.]WEK06627.1 MAG: tetratricopeptide repeat protein [Devosia sp.]